MLSHTAIVLVSATGAGALAEDVGALRQTWEHGKGTGWETRGRMRGEETTTHTQA